MGFLMTIKQKSMLWNWVGNIFLPMWYIKWFYQISDTTDKIVCSALVFLNLLIVAVQQWKAAQAIMFNPYYLSSKQFAIIMFSISISCVVLGIYAFVKKWR